MHLWKGQKYAISEISSLCISCIISFHKLTSSSFKNPALFSQIGLILSKMCPSFFVLENQRVLRPSGLAFAIQSMKVF